MVPVTACTPLGLWIYEDPGVTMSRVRVNTKGQDASPVVRPVKIKADDTLVFPREEP